MIRKLAFVAIAGAALAFTTQQASAQDVGGGYQFGYGFAAGASQLPGHGFRHGLRPGFGGGFQGLPVTRFHERIEAPPYFAMFPPVYYDAQIIRRPYGVSPFAAPAGIMPVEMTVAPNPETVKNPYYQPQPVSGQKEQAADKTTEDNDT